MLVMGQDGKEDPVWELLLVGALAKRSCGHQGHPDSGFSTLDGIGLCIFPKEDS